MKKRTHLLPPEDVYPLDNWAIVERKFSPDFVAQNETIFAIANGYLGFRGVPDEGRPVFHHGTFVNGFHETWPITHPEGAFGLAQTGQTIVNVPDFVDAAQVRIYLEDTVIDMSWQIPDDEAIPLVYEMIRKEGLVLGGSSGINVAGAIRMARELGPGHTIVTILCDSALRYQERLFNREYLEYILPIGE